MSDHRPGDWRGVGTWLRPRKGHFHGHCIPPGLASGQGDRDPREALRPLVGEEKGGRRAGLGCGPTGNRGQEGRKAAGRAGARTPWRGHEEVGLYYEATCVPTKDVLKSQLPGPQNVILCGNRVIEVIIR